MSNEEKYKQALWKITNLERVCTWACDAHLMECEPECITARDVAKYALGDEWQKMYDAESEMIQEQVGKWREQGNE